MDTSTEKALIISASLAIVVMGAYNLQMVAQDPSILALVSAYDTATTTVIRPPTRTPTRVVSSVLATRLSPTTPQQRLVVTNPTAVTQNVILGVFGIQSGSAPSTLANLNFKITTSNNDLGSVVSAVRLIDVSSNKVYAGIVSGDTVMFTNLSSALSANTWKDLTLVADIRPNVNNIASYSTLVWNSIVVMDTFNRPVSVATVNDVSSNETRFVVSSLQIGNASATLGAPIFNGSTIIGYNASFNFTLTNTGNTDLYVAKNTGMLLATSSLASAGGTVVSSVIPLISSTPDAMMGDTSTAYVLPAGTSRAFAAAGLLRGNGVPGYNVLRITGVYFGGSASNLRAMLLPAPASLSVTAAF